MKGWIFSPILDFVFFWLPTLILLAVWYACGVELGPEGAFVLLLAEAALDRGHVFGTVGPLARRKEERRISGRALAAGLFAVGAITLLAFAIAPVFSVSLISLFAIWHVMRQQFGWVMISRRKAGETAGRLLDSLEIWNIMLVPVIWWLSPLGPDEKAYFPPQAYPFVVPALIAKVALGLHCAVHLAYVLGLLSRAARGQSVNWPKLSLMAATWWWFFVPLVLIRSRAVFFYSLMLIHGSPYLLYAFRDTKTPTRSLTRLAPALKALGIPLLYVLLTAGAGALWWEAGHSRRLVTTLFGRMAGAVLFLPLLSHYYFDSFIWRKASWKIPR